MNVTIFFIVFKKCYDLCYKPNQSFIKTMATYVQIIEIVVTNVTQISEIILLLYLTNNLYKF